MSLYYIIIIIIISTLEILPEYHFLKYLKPEKSVVVAMFLSKSNKVHIYLQIYKDIKLRQDRRRQSMNQQVNIFFSLKL